MSGLLTTAGLTNSSTRVSLIYKVGVRLSSSVTGLVGYTKLCSESYGTALVKPLIGTVTAFAKD